MGHGVGDRVERGFDDEGSVVAGERAGGEAGGADVVVGRERDEGSDRLGRGLLDDAEQFVCPVDRVPVAAGALCPGWQV